ncbi:phosphoribosylanthranilate isomerase [Lachnospiraceae bacterium G11]|nr:phosphoribosylanthranilate isomerase [Lachnospiraceae bacterium G11]
MTKIKLCGLKRECDIEAVNKLNPDFIGFVFAEKSKRYVNPIEAAKLKEMLGKDIKAVGVFVNESPEAVAELLNKGTIDMAQLHGSEDEEYISMLRSLTDKPLIKAIKVQSKADIEAADGSSADYVLLDSGAGTGMAFNWQLIKGIKRPYFLAGGLNPENVAEAVKTLNPYAVDVSSGIETDGLKDEAKMADFVSIVRKESDND